MTEIEILEKLIKTSYLINDSKKACFLKISKYLPENIIEKLMELLREEKRIQVETGKKYEDKLNNLLKQSGQILTKKVKKQLKNIEQKTNYQEIKDLEDTFNQL